MLDFATEPSGKIDHIGINLKRSFEFGKANVKFEMTPPTTAGLAPVPKIDSSATCHPTLGDTWGHIKQNCLGIDPESKALAQPVWSNEAMVADMGGLAVYLTRTLAADQIISDDAKPTATDTIVGIAFNSTYDGKLVIDRTALYTSFFAAVEQPLHGGYDRGMSMAMTLQAAREALRAVCECGGRATVHHRPGADVRSMQGQHSFAGVALRCTRCGRSWRPVHEMLGIEGQYHTTVLFERPSWDFCLDKGSPSATRRLKEHHGIEVGRMTVLQHAEQRGAEAREFIERKLQLALEESEARRGKPLRIAEVFVQMDSCSGKTVQPLARPTPPTDDTAIERTPVRGLPKAKRPVEGATGQAALCPGPRRSLLGLSRLHRRIRRGVVPLQGLAATRGWQDGTLAAMTSDGEPSIQETGKGAFVLTSSSSSITLMP